MNLFEVSNSQTVCEIKVTPTQNYKNLSSDELVKGSTLANLKINGSNELKNEPIKVDDLDKDEKW